MSKVLLPNLGIRKNTNRSLMNISQNNRCVVFNRWFSNIRLLVDSTGIDGCNEHGIDESYDDRSQNDTSFKDLKSFAEWFSVCNSILAFVSVRSSAAIYSLETPYNESKPINRAHTILQMYLILDIDDENFIYMSFRLLRACMMHNWSGLISEWLSLSFRTVTAYLADTTFKIYLIK